MSVRFWKMSGAGNDFVLIEKAALPRGSAVRTLARKVCDRRRGVGADGLLVMGKAGGLPSLDYYNADGSAAFCGNGTRCAAWWAHSRGWTRGRKAFALRTSEGRLAVRVAGPGRAAVAMPAPGAARLFPRLAAAGRTYAVHAINTGVPHAVVFVKDVDSVDVEGLGRALRRHRAFAPAGANADFVEVRRSGLVVRTYERGVEAETLACGTGAVAAALVAARLGRARTPARVLTRGGDELRVRFQAAAGGRFSGVELEGPARIVFTGEVAP